MIKTDLAVKEEFEILPRVWKDIEKLAFQPNYEKFLIIQKQKYINYLIADGIPLKLNRYRMFFRKSVINAQTRVSLGNYLKEEDGKSFLKDLGEIMNEYLRLVDKRKTDSYLVSRSPLVYLLQNPADSMLEKLLSKYEVFDKMLEKEKELGEK